MNTESSPIDWSTAEWVNVILVAAEVFYDTAVKFIVEKENMKTKFRSWTKLKSGYKIVDHLWIIRCPDGAVHPQEFQAGRAPYAAYRTRKAARLAASAISYMSSPHRVTKVIVPR